VDLRDLSSYPSYKQTGLWWLERVPIHWRATRLKHVARIQTGVTLGKDYRGLQLEARPYLRVANVQTGRLNLASVKKVEVPPDVARASELQIGDVLMTEGGDPDKLGRGCIWRGEVPGCLHQNHIFVSGTSS
jgi:type I restriction enzyme S subunit